MQFFLLCAVKAITTIRSHTPPIPGSVKKQVPGGLTDRALQYQFFLLDVICLSYLSTYHDILSTRITRYNKTETHSTVSFVFSVWSFLKAF